MQGGSLFRWFEQLCRIKIERLRNAVIPKGDRIQGNVIPALGGVYVFWWMTGPAKLRSKECNRRLQLKGPGGRWVGMVIDDDWLGLSTDLPIPLYVGKSGGSLRNRIGQHLMLSKLRILSRGRRSKKEKAPTTSCQLRAGVEHLFPFEIDTRSLILDNVGFSFVELPNDGNAVNRFYLEDLAIGLMRPVLNVDIER